MTDPSSKTFSNIPPTTWNDEIRFGPALTTYSRSS